MAASLLITLRETLEASLVVGIVLAFLERTDERRWNPYVWWGVGVGIALSLALAWVLQTFVGGFTGRAEELYEGIMMLSAAGLITWMVLWMLREGGRMRSHLEERVDAHARMGHPLGIFFLVCVSVLREGIETVIFLQAAMLQSQGTHHNLGAVLGIVIALSAAWLVFRGLHLFSLKKFFTVSGILLVLFAAGLVAHGIHELEEAQVLPPIVEHVWNLNPAAPEGGPYPLLHENGAVGSLLKGLFGYNGNPSLLELLSYAVYLVGVGVLWRFKLKTVG